MRKLIVFVCGIGFLLPASGVEHQCFSEVMSAADYQACIEKANAAADKELKAVFGKTLAVISGPSVAPAEKAKRKTAAEKAQAKWQEYRDAECALAAEVFGNGSASMGAAMECRFGLTNIRIKYLHESYNVK